MVKNAENPYKKSEALPQQAQAENHLPSLYGSPGASWQDKQAEGEAVPDVSIWYILYARFPKGYLNRPLGQPTHRPMGSVALPLPLTRHH